MSDFVDVLGYLVIEPTHLRGDAVVKAKVTRATQKLPQLSNGEVAVRLTVRLPTSVFSPVADVFVEVPADLVSKAVVRGGGTVSRPDPARTQPVWIDESSTGAKQSSPAASSFDRIDFDALSAADRAVAAWVDRDDNGASLFGCTPSMVVQVAVEGYVSALSVQDVPRPDSKVLATEVRNLIGRYASSAKTDDDRAALDNLGHLLVLVSEANSALSQEIQHFQAAELTARDQVVDLEAELADLDEVREDRTRIQELEAEIAKLRPQVGGSR